MFRPDRRTAVLPLTAAILLGTAGSALAIPNTDPNNPPPPPPNQAPTAALNVTPNPGLVAPQLQVTAISARIPGGGLDNVLNRNAVSFDASGSSDPDGSISKYLWDLDGTSSSPSGNTCGCRGCIAAATCSGGWTRRASGINATTRSRSCRGRGSCRRRSWSARPSARPSTSTR